MSGPDSEPILNEAAIPPAPAPETPAVAVTGRDWQGWLVFLCGTTAIFWGLFGALGSGWGFWDWTVGVSGLTWSSYLALAGFLLGVFFSWHAWKSNIARPRFLRWLGMLASIIYIGWLLSYLIMSWSSPAIHDVSTDLADPPQFATLTLRPDNLDKVPGADDPDMKNMTPQQRWVMISQKNYGNIRSVRINEPVVKVIEKAERLAQARDWDIAVVSPEQGRMEATATSALFRFKDDIVLRVRPTENGLGSIVDMRSVSRVGDNDLGVNAKRVREFLADLTGTVSPAS